MQPTTMPASAPVDRPELLPGEGGDMGRGSCWSGSSVTRLPFTPQPRKESSMMSCGPAVRTWGEAMAVAGGGWEAVAGGPWPHYINYVNPGHNTRTLATLRKPLEPLDSLSRRGYAESGLLNPRPRLSSIALGKGGIYVKLFMYVCMYVCMYVYSLFKPVGFQGRGTN